MLVDDAVQDETEAEPITDPTDPEAVETPAEEGEQPEAPEAEGSEGETDVITLDGEPIGHAEQDDDESEPIKRIRKEYRELSRKYKALEHQVTAEQPPAATQAPVLGAKPTLEACEWDSEKYEAALDQWHDKKSEVEAHLRDQEAKQKATQDEILKKIDRYEKEKAKIRIADFEEAEAAFADAISGDARAVFLQYADRPEAVVYAIGKSPELRQKFASINNPGQLIKEIAILETRLSVNKAAAKAKIPPPEKPAPAGTAGGGTDETLARLRAEADKTGDLSKVIAYKARLRKAQSK